MTALKISLRAGERIFINGAVLRPDRKVTFEFLNSVTFLLEQHVLGPEDTTTPLRQLYFMIQTAIIDPKESAGAIEMARHSLKMAQATFTTPSILAELTVVEGLIERERFFECLRVLRRQFELEDAIISGQAPGERESVDYADIEFRSPAVAACR